MLNQKLLDEISAKISQILSESPAKDIEKNLKAMLQSVFSKLDLVTRDEFDVQQQVLLRTREKLDRLEAQVAELAAKSNAAAEAQTVSAVQDAGTPPLTPT